MLGEVPNGDGLVFHAARLLGHSPERSSRRQFPWGARGSLPSLPRERAESKFFIWFPVRARDIIELATNPKVAQACNESRDRLDLARAHGGSTAGSTFAKMAGVSLTVS